MSSGGLETEQEYPYEGKNDKCKFDKSEAAVTINGSVAISKDEQGGEIFLVTNNEVEGEIIWKSEKNNYPSWF